MNFYFNWKMLEQKLEIWGKRKKKIQSPLKPKTMSKWFGLLFAILALVALATASDSDVSNAKRTYRSADAGSPQKARKCMLTRRHAAQNFISPLSPLY